MTVFSIVIISSVLSRTVQSTTAVLLISLFVIKSSLKQDAEFRTFHLLSLDRIYQVVNETLRRLMPYFEHYKKAGLYPHKLILS